VALALMLPPHTRQGRLTLVVHRSVLLRLPDHRLQLLHRRQRLPSERATPLAIDLTFRIALDN
jgi:hypothetical protein